jgi:hypothetical protein
MWFMLEAILAASIKSGNQNGGSKVSHIHVIIQAFAPPRERRRPAGEFRNETKAQLASKKLALPLSVGAIVSVTPDLPLPSAGRM